MVVERRERRGFTEKRERGSGGGPGEEEGSAGGAERRHFFKDGVRERKLKLQTLMGLLGRGRRLVGLCCQERARDLRQNQWLER